MPGISVIAVLPATLVFVLAVVYVALQPSHPERQSQPRQRMTTIVATVVIGFVAMLFVIIRLFVGSAEWLGSTAAAAGSIAPIAWGRGALAGGSLPAFAVDVILVALALVTVAPQYVAKRTFSRRSLSLHLDALGRSTGTAERVVHSIGAVITAGVGEEIVFRALLPALIYPLTSSVAVAVLIPLVLFAVLHFDQGYSGILNAALLGATATVIFLVTQQLWWSISLHAVANLIATLIVPEILRARVRRIARQAVVESSQNSLLSTDAAS